MIEVPVLIAGGGPVGMTLSLELAHHGVRSLVAERNPSTTKHPKMDLTNGRSMELYRRLGMAAKLRAVGVPMENCFDISWITSLAGHELHRFRYLSAADETKRRREQNDGTLTLEAPMRVSQIVIEPVLKRAAEENPLVQARFGWQFQSFEQDAQGVTSTLRNSATGETEQVRSRYLAGCDGGGSVVREQAGIDNEGTPNAANMYMVHFRSNARDVLQRFGIAWHYQTGGGVLVAQNDVDTWTLHTFWPPEVDRSKLDPRKVVEEWVGCKFDFEILVANPWSAHYLVAKRYRRGRVFLAGDASHQYMPTGGYGMNSGVADAVNLGWKLAAAVNGWGGETLLDSYEAERRPVAKLSWATSEQHLQVRFAFAQLYQSMGDLSGEGANPVSRRQEAGRRVADLGNAENEAWGTEHGYRYDSAVVAREAGTPPAFDPLVYTPSTYPGSRLPHLFLEDGRAVYDLLDKEMTLLVLGDVQVAPLEQAAHDARVPLRVVRIDDAKAARLYERRLVLVRPDQHVAWRGQSLPSNPAELVETVAGQAKRDATEAVN